MNNRTASLVLSALLLAACAQRASDPTGSTDPRLDLRPDYPQAVRPQLQAWLATLPASFLDGVKRYEVIFLAQDGKLYPTSDDTITRQGRIFTEAAGVRRVQFQSGELGPTYPSGDFKPGLSALSSSYPSCKAVNDGPYWRAWSGTGYGAIASILNISSASFPAPIGSRPWAAYQYMGGQASNAATEVDAGLVYYNNRLRVFYNVNGQYQEAQNISVKGASLANARYPTRLSVNGQNILIMRVDRPGDAPSILLNLPAAPGFNSAGTDQYWKRVVTIANGDLPAVFPNGYDGSVKYGAVNASEYSDSKLGTFSGSNLHYTSWSVSSINPYGCAVTPKAVTTVSGSPQTDSVTVKIDMSR